MSFENAPQATAQITVVEPVLVFVHPEEVVYSFGFEAGATVDGWAGTNVSMVRSSGAAAHSGDHLGYHRTVGVGTRTAERTVTGLDVGRSYTFRAWGRRGPSSIATLTLAAGVSGKGLTSTVTNPASWVEFSYTFTATSTSHVLQLQTTATSNSGDIAYWDDLSLTGNEWSEYTTEPVIDISEGTISLDSGWSPYLQGSVTVPLTSEELLEQIDPIDNPGQRVIVTATDGTTTTEFDAVLRGRTVDHEQKTLTLEIESDERLLQEFSKVTDDKTPRDHEADLRDLVNYVLDEAIPGTALEAGTTTADLTARWSAQNAFLNPDGISAVAPNNWITAGNSTVTANATANAGQGNVTGYIVATSSAVGQSFVQIPQTVSTKKGDIWNFSAYMHKANSLTGTQNGVLRIYEVDAAGAIVRQIESTPKALLQSGAGTPYVWDRHDVTFVVTDPRTTKLYTYASMIATAGSQAFAIDSAQLTQGPLLLDYFSGSRTPAGYTTVWGGQTPTANGAPSERKPADGIERLPELFTWEAGVSAWDFLMPLVSAAGFRLFCDEQRRWYLIDPQDWHVPGRYSVRPAITTSGQDVIDIASGEWYDGAVITYKWEDSDGISHSQKDSAGINGRVYAETIEREYPGPGRAQAILNKSQGRGRVQDVTVQTNYNMRPGQEVQIDLPGTAAQIGTISRTDFGLSSGLVHLESAGLVETPAGAIDLLAGTIDGLVGTIDSLNP